MRYRGDKAAVARGGRIYLTAGGRSWTIVAAIAADTLLARSVAKRMMRKRDHG